MKRTFLFLLSMMVLAACHTEKKVVESEVPQEQGSGGGGGAAIITMVESTPPASVASPRVIVYKMLKDYSRNVPVTLSADKKTIASYPHPRDVYTNGKLAFPTELKNGYWLDNRGINENVAFLSYTYEEYAALTDVPPLDVLYSKIIDNDPLTEMWVCGRRFDYHDLVNDLNEIITNGKMEEIFKKMK